MSGDVGSVFHVTQSPLHGWPHRGVVEDWGSAFGEDCYKSHRTIGSAIDMRIEF